MNNSRMGKRGIRCSPMRTLMSSIVSGLKVFPMLMGR